MGKLTVEQPTKIQLDQNVWYLCTAADPKLAEPIAQPPKYTADTLLQDIKAKLQARGTLGIRGLGRMFRILDNNGNRTLDLKELQYGLGDFGVYIDEEQAGVIMAHFDRDRNGVVNYDEFLRAIRGDLNEYRITLIRKAYQKLDENSDGTVKLEDIAKLYDVSKHPDIVGGRKKPQEVYMEFMKLWDTQVADGVVTFEEFCDYFRDVSASIDRDDYFALMMQNSWKIQV